MYYQRICVSVFGSVCLRSSHIYAKSQVCNTINFYLLESMYVCVCTLIRLMEHLFFIQICGKSSDM